MRFLKKLGIFLLLLIIAFIIFKWETIAQTYHYLESDKPENRLKYFQNPYTYFKSNVIQKSEKAYKFQVSDTLMTLPETFVSVDSTVFSKTYLEDCRYEGMMVLRDGNILYENYWNGLNENDTHSAFSVTKTILSILIGIAIDEGLINSKEDLVTTYLPQFQDTWYKDITIDDCLDMISGVKWENDIPMLIDYLLLWSWDLTTAEEFLLERESWHEPETFRVYNSMDALMAGLVLKSVIGDRSISDYMQEKLWEPLGTENDAYLTYFQENDVENVVFGLSASLKDLAKIGQLYLQKGRWNGKQIVSESWVNQSFTAHREDNMPKVDRSLTWFYDAYGWGYNNFWWIPDDSSGDEIFAWGIYGQLIYVNRSENVVIVSFRSNPEENETHDPHFQNRSMIDFMQAICYSI